MVSVAVLSLSLSSLVLFVVVRALAVALVMGR